MPTIIVEDGSGVTDANSYCSLAEVRSFADNRGLSLPVVDDDVEIAMLSAMDFIESKRDQFQGVKTDSAQALQFPRVRLRIDGYPVDDNVIPTCLKFAQCRATFEVADGLDLQPIIDGMFITKDVVGPLETEFEQIRTDDGLDVVEAIVSFLKPLFVKNTGYRLGRNKF